MKDIIFFNPIEVPDLRKVGGKAQSLILMTSKGMPVPQGFVLTADYFEPWIAKLQTYKEWQTLTDSDSKTSLQAQSRIKSYCSKLLLNDDQKKIIQDAAKSLQILGNTHIFAVRSSSPEEDLNNASFAGSYETILGVTTAGLETAIRQIFTSLFDERVLLYKRQMGIQIIEPRIAIIVQAQVDSDTAGVAFSINPLNNCYDEALINANYGLGDTVVSGKVTPDTYIADKISMKMIEKKSGGKEFTTILGDDGGTYDKKLDNSQYCLTEEQVLGITNLLKKVEDIYQRPVDIEWAISEENIHLLQARPITTYLPLPDEMMTLPGAPKNLYADATLIEQGLQEPLSVLGTDFMSYILREMTAPFGGDVYGTDGMVFTSGGRYYLHLTHSIKLLGTKTPMAPGSYEDPTVTSIIKSIDLKEYTSQPLPKKLRNVKIKMLFSFFPYLIPTIKAYRDPVQFMQGYNEELPEQLRALEITSKNEMPLIDWAPQLASSLNYFIMKKGLPMVLAPRLAYHMLGLMFTSDEELKSDIASLGTFLPGNKTVEMGMHIYELSSYPDIEKMDSPEQFAEAIKSDSLSLEFLESWKAFLDEYGSRCIREIDAATPRLNENSVVLFKQIKSLVTSPEKRSGQTVFEKARLKREVAYDKLHTIAQKKGQVKAFENRCRVITTLGHYRETPKHYIVKVVDIFRKRVLQLSESFIKENRLDQLDQIFDLTISDIDKGVKDPNLDLRALSEKNTQLVNRIRRSPLSPRVIDSRGKIFNAPRKQGVEGELVGLPISPGIARGKVKVLRSSDEKVLLSGEILVAKSTDPGWTPLFLNAGGIVLEVGGVLQHGAVVAREYGIPCVSGIENAVSILRDGQLVEVDGSSGIVRIIEVFSKEIIKND